MIPYSALPSIGWDTIDVRNSHFREAIFRQFREIPKCTSISTTYSLRQSLPPKSKKATLNTATICLVTLPCFLLGTCLIVTSQEFLVSDICLWNWKQRFPTFFTVYFTLSFWLSHYKTIKYLNSHNMFFENRPLPSHCLRKIGYTLHEPRPYGLNKPLLNNTFSFNTLQLF